MVVGMQGDRPRDTEKKDTKGSCQVMYGCQWMGAWGRVDFFFERDLVSSGRGVNLQSFQCI
jgi:hypothetical protein